jgi:hypothetical protein
VRNFISLGFRHCSAQKFEDVVKVQEEEIMVDKKINISQEIKVAYHKLAALAKNNVQTELAEDRLDDLEAELFGQITDLPRERQNRLIEMIQTYKLVVDNSDLLIDSKKE